MGHPELVAPGRPLHLDDVGAELAEQRGDIRPGDNRPEVENAKPGQRQLRLRRNGRTAGWQSSGLARGPGRSESGQARRCGGSGGPDGGRRV